MNDLALFGNYHASCMRGKGSYEGPRPVAGSQTTDRQTEQRQAGMNMVVVGNIFPIFAYCGLVGFPHSADILIFAPFATSTKRKKQTNRERERERER